MAKRPRGRRAANHADFAGPNASEEAIETLSKAAAKANAKAGHNSGDVPEETVANHITLIKAAEVEWRELRDKASAAQGVLRNRYKVAKGDGVDVDSLKLAFRIAERSSGEVVSEQRNVGRYLRIMGSPLGTQWNLFAEEEGEDGKPANAALDAELQGQHAYSNNEKLFNNPFQPGTEEHQQWSVGWTNAQNANARSMGTTDGETAAH